MVKKTATKKDEELLELGRKLEAFYESGYVNRKQALWYSFLKGMVAGFGAFLGGTILIALLIWFLGMFDNVPLLSRFVEVVERTLQTQ